MRPFLLAALIACTPALGQAEAQQLPLSHKGSGTLYVQTSLTGSQQSGWLVDTGSDYSVIDQTSIDKLVSLGQARYLKKLRGKMADGSERVIPLYVVDKMNLAGDCEVRNVKVAVLPHSTRRIMGLSALRQLAPFSVSFDPPMLTVSGCQTTSNAASATIATDSSPEAAALNAADAPNDPAQLSTPQKKPLAQSASGDSNGSEPQP